MKNKNRLFISVVLPCYKQVTILQANLNTVIEYPESRNEKYQWEEY